MPEIQRSPEEYLQTQFIVPVTEVQVPSIIRCASDYADVDQALAWTRKQRKDLAHWLKDEPYDMKNLRPAEGMCFLARKTWESANALFNKFDAILMERDLFLQGSMRKWQDQEAERVRREEEKKRQEAEAKAEAERARLRAEAEAARERMEQEAVAERARINELAEQARENKDKEEAARLAALAKETELRLKREAEERERQLQEQASQVRAEEVFVESRMPEETSMNTKKKFKGRVVDMVKLVRAIADGKHSYQLLLVNESALNKLADAMGGQNPPPGVVFEESTSFSRKAVR
jgi:hypothetical protein